MRANFPDEQAINGTTRKILGMLVEGVSMRAVTRLMDASINTVAKAAHRRGNAYAEYHATKLRGIQGRRRIECDEILELRLRETAQCAGGEGRARGAGMRGRGRPSTRTAS